MSAQKRKATEQEIKEQVAPSSKKRDTTSAFLLTDKVPALYTLAREQTLFGRTLREFDTSSTQCQMWLLHNRRVVATLQMTAWRAPSPVLWVLDYLILPGESRFLTLDVLSGCLARDCRNRMFPGVASDIYISMYPITTPTNVRLGEMMPVTLETKNPEEQAHNLKWVKLLSSMEAVQGLITLLEAQEGGCDVDYKTVRVKLADQREVDASLHQLRVLLAEKGFDLEDFERERLLQTGVIVGGLPWLLQGSYSTGMCTAPRALAQIECADADSLKAFGYARVSNLLTQFGVTKSVTAL